MSWLAASSHGRALRRARVASRGARRETETNDGLDSALPLSAASTIVDAELEAAAWGALGMGQSSRALRDRLHDSPAFLNALAAASGGRFVPVPGGVLIRNGAGAVVGAVGISGNRSEKDEYCAITGVRAAGYASDPVEPEPTGRAAPDKGRDQASCAQNASR